jgi:phenylacetate-coenzyme A ligase PaaK-like adenylate-forming protein
MTGQEHLRLHHLDAMTDGTSELVARLDWSAERLAEHRDDLLRGLLSTALDRSPWHRRRLAGLDVRRATAADLAELPAMTKDDLMDNFDEIVTDRRLTLAGVEAHLATLTGEESYLLDGYHAVASSGSSGRRGVFVWDWGAWAAAYAALLRHELRAWMGAFPGPVTMASVAAGRPTHASRAIFTTFTRPGFAVRGFPVSRPVAETVEGLERLQPMILGGYPTALCALAHEARAGRLRIAPRRIVCYAEPLLPEMRALLEETWAAPVGNWWCSSEAQGMAISCGQGPAMHLNEDLLVVEPVDERGAPVPAGVRSAKVYLTHLFNPVLPLIRYELTDEVTVLDGRCPCGCAHRMVADVEGRLDDGFRYGAVDVHPHVFRSPLSRQRHVVEYQVRQHPGGAEILVRTDGPAALDDLRLEIAADLAGLGAPAQATIVEVDRIDRQESGKFKRFVPWPVAEDCLV